MQISEHRINAVNAKKLPENRPQKRRRYRRPKLTPNVSLQAVQETPKFPPVFLPTQMLTPIFHPYFLQIFHPYFFSPILFFTHAFYKVSPILFFTQSFHPYFFHPFFFSPILFTKFSPILYFTHTFFTHTFFTHSFYKVFKHTFVSPIPFPKFLIPMCFFNHVFHSCLLKSSLENEPPCLVYFHHIIFIPHYVFTTFKA